MIIIVKNGFWFYGGPSGKLGLVFFFFFFFKGALIEPHKTLDIAKNMFVDSSGPSIKIEHKVSNLMPDLQDSMWSITAIVFTDAAFSKVNCNSSLGFTMSSNEYLVFAGVFKGLMRFLTKEAKAGAILHSLRKSKDLGFSKIQIFSGALKVVKATSRDDDWVLKPIIQDILDFSISFENVGFSFTLRNLNGNAHLLTKFSFFYLDDDFEWTDNFPHWL